MSSIQRFEASLPVGYSSENPESLVRNPEGEFVKYEDYARLREFVARVAKQKPEKPDYWCSCGQCDRNISEAEDLLTPLS